MTYFGIFWLCCWLLWGMRNGLLWLYIQYQLFPLFPHVISTLAKECWWKWGSLRLCFWHEAHALGANRVMCIRTLLELLWYACVYAIYSHDNTQARLRPYYVVTYWESNQVTEPDQVKAIMNGPLVAASVSISNLDDCGLEAFICRKGANLCVLKQLWCTLLSAESIAWQLILDQWHIYLSVCSPTAGRPFSVPSGDRGAGACCRPHAGVLWTGGRWGD